MEEKKLIATAYRLEANFLKMVEELAKAKHISKTELLRRMILHHYNKWSVPDWPIDPPKRRRKKS